MSGISGVISLSAFSLAVLTASYTSRNFADGLPKNAVLVNCARAGLVDTAALVEALRAHRIGGAAIDVFDEEPLPPDSPLLTLDNVTLTPHIAGTTVDAFANSVEIMLRQLSRVLAGEEAPNRVV